jgi:hypothetical protein
MDEFGASFAVYDDLAIVVAPMADPGDGTFGMAYAYTRTAGGLWTLHSTISASPPAFGVGTAVALQGTTAVLGSAVPGDDLVYPHHAAALVYEWDGTSWDHTATLVGPEAEYRGLLVAIDQGRIAMSLQGVAPSSGAGVGVVNIYARSGVMWTLETQLSAADTIFEDHFAYSMQIKGERVIVGAPGRGRGTAYIFSRKTGAWIQEAKLIPPVSYSFGTAVALEGSKALVGAPAYCGNGRTWVYGVRDGVWMLEDEIISRPPYPLECVDNVLGSAIAWAGDTAVIGKYQSACGRSCGFGDASFSLVMRRQGTWHDRPLPDPADAQPLAERVAISGSTVFVSASHSVSHYSMVSPDSIYVYELDCTPAADWDNNGDVDLTDFAALAGCLSGPNVDAPDSCLQGDLDLDNDVDLADFGLFNLVISPFK